MNVKSSVSGKSLAPWSRGLRRKDVSVQSLGAVLLGLESKLRRKKR